jgi:hypothetical protein
MVCPKGDAEENLLGVYAGAGVLRDPDVYVVYVVQIIERQR